MQTGVIYARYSSDSQTEQSIEGQLRVCEEYAQKNNILILNTYIDRAMTGTNDNRPDFQRMLKDSARHEWEFVIVYKLDRFSRNKYESTIHKRTLKNNGVKLLSAMENIPDTPEGIILESLLEGMNMYFSAELSQKVHRGLTESYIKGQYTGGYLLFGYDVENMKYVPNELESNIVREIFTKYADGYTVKSIAANLKARGIRTKRGEYLLPTKLYRMLQNTKYNGRVKHGNKEYDNIFPKLIDDITWKKVQDITESNKHAPGRKKEIFDFILSGKLVCGECGHLMVGESGTSQTGEIYYYYSCLTRRRKRGECGMRSVKKQELEDTVIHKTWEMLSNADTIDMVANNIFQLHKKQTDESALLHSLEAQRQTALKASQNLISAIEMGIITEQTKLRLKELETQISQLDFDIEQEKQRTYTYLTIEEIKNYLNSIIGGDVDDISVRKGIVNTFIREVVYYGDRIDIVYNFSDRYEKYDIKKESKEIIGKQSEVTSTASHVTTAAHITISSYKLSCSAPQYR
jgi:DNA invertase Pin-like site-specific DNA recombinase